MAVKFCCKRTSCLDISQPKSRVEGAGPGNIKCFCNRVQPNAEMPVRHTDNYLHRHNQHFYNEYRGHKWRNARTEIGLIQRSRVLILPPDWLQSHRHPSQPSTQSIFFGNPDHHLNWQEPSNNRDQKSPIPARRITLQKRIREIVGDDAKEVGLSGPKFWYPMIKYKPKCFCGITNLFASRFWYPPTSHSTTAIR